ncbi:MAG: DUF1015 domain-containing protein [Deltaproteobacteria bacterium]|jgi:uncharacterized protein (DUF1015 family)|nr:DUF1015 domain-containing protein [Deltaproteobacteria bacterium]
MAEIAPFRGLRYNPEEVPDLSQVTIPPYDVISAEEQRAFHENNPYNFIRLELGLTSPEDTPVNNPHTRAAAWIEQWTQRGILVRNPEPSIYRYELDYKTESDQVKTRKGFICALRLEDFSSGMVRPHEKTFQTAKNERFSLMLACNANLSPVFGLYPDVSGLVYSALCGGTSADPAVSFTDATGMAHRLWPVTDRLILDRARKLMLDKPIFIADGHHRYETALNYRNEIRKRNGGGSPNASYEFVMVYLTAMNDPGLTILPTHRLLRNLGDWDCERFVERAKSLFDVERFEARNGTQLKWREAIRAGGLRKDTAIGVYCRKAECVYVLTAKRSEASSVLAGKGTPRALRPLDVVVLDQLLLRDLLGLSDQFLADERNISFMHDFAEAVEAVRSNRFDAGFFINHTRIEQVREVASAGLTMPHKSTYFYPKVTSGLVINPLLPNEEIV